MFFYTPDDESKSVQKEYTKLRSQVEESLRKKTSKGIVRDLHEQALELLFACFFDNMLTPGVVRMDFENQEGMKQTVYNSNFKSWPEACKSVLERRKLKSKNVSPTLAHSRGAVYI